MMSIFKLPSFLKRKPPAPVEEQSHFQGVKESDPATEEVGEPIYQRSKTMPTVKGKKYPYTAAGRKAAAGARKPKGKGMSKGKR